MWVVVVRFSQLSLFSVGKHFISGCPQPKLEVDWKAMLSIKAIKIAVTYAFMIISSSSQTLSWTTSSACPNMLASKLSSPSKLANVSTIVAVEARSHCACGMVLVLWGNTVLHRNIWTMEHIGMHLRSTPDTVLTAFAFPFNVSVPIRRVHPEMEGTTSRNEHKYIPWFGCLWVAL